MDWTYSAALRSVVPRMCMLLIVRMREETPHSILEGMCTSVEPPNSALKTLLEQHTYACIMHARMNSSFTHTPKYRMCYISWCYVTTRALQSEPLM